ncbi:1-phosphatidylinositol-3-phosphate 5-kinase FAB1B [Raphanus sativus]|nr:1-phosphatidylinositol-3-phosphate 5-kinase FAB1B [Raphanus sativus]
MSSSRSLDPLSYTKALHARISYGEDGTLGKVKYTVTCYYANGLRRCEQVTKDRTGIIHQVRTCLLQIFIRVYQHEKSNLPGKNLGNLSVATKQLKSGKETKMDVLIMENLLFGRTVKRL